MRMLLAALRCEKGDIEGNLGAHLRLLDAAAAAGCELALFPEMSLSGSVEPAARPERLVPLEHPAVTALAEASGTTGVGVCFGIAERAAGGEPYITQVVAAGGSVRGVQRKRHLGDGEEAFTAASESRVFEHGGVRFGVAICAEAGFDAPFDAAAAAGAQVVLVPGGAGAVRPAYRRGVLAGGAFLVGGVRAGRRAPPRPAPGAVDRAGRPGRFHRGRGLPRPGRAGHTRRDRRRPPARLARGRPHRRPTPVIHGSLSSMTYISSRYAHMRLQNLTINTRLCRDE